MFLIVWIIFKRYDGSLVDENEANENTYRVVADSGEKVMTFLIVTSL